MLPTHAHPPTSAEGENEIEEKKTKEGGGGRGGEEIQIFIARPTAQNMQKIATYIKIHKGGEYKLYCTPRRSLTAERILEEKGVFGEIFVGEFVTDWIRLEEDLWSLEIPGSFRELVVVGGRYSKRMDVSGDWIPSQHYYRA